MPSSFRYTLGLLSQLIAIAAPELRPDTLRYARLVLSVGNSVVNSDEKLEALAAQILAMVEESRNPTEEEWDAAYAELATQLEELAAKRR